MIGIPFIWTRPMRPPRCSRGASLHGMLSAAYISAVFGMELPGPGAIYISQTMNFKAPVKIGDTVGDDRQAHRARAGKEARPLRDRLLVVNGKPVLVGEALLMVPSRPALSTAEAIEAEA